MRKTIICFIGEDGEIILDKKLIGVSLKEDFVISKSIEFFNDEDPCMIHRSAVMKATYMEIFEYLMECSVQGRDKVLWKELPLSIRESIDLSQTPHAMSFTLGKVKLKDKKNK